MTEALDDLELVPPGALRDRLVSAVLRGVKTATSRLAVLDEMTGTPAEPPGTRLRLLDSAGNAVAVVEIADSRVIPLGLVGDDVAAAEGDWFENAAAWRVAHERFWTSCLDDIHAFTGDASWAIDDASPVVVRFFEVIEVNGAGRAA